jgi:hypothetical protein
MIDIAEMKTRTPATTAPGAVRRERLDHGGPFVRWLWSLSREDGEHHVEVRISRQAIAAVMNFHRIADEVADAVLTDGARTVEAMAHWPRIPSLVEVTAARVTPHGGRPPRRGSWIL